MKGFATSSNPYFEGVRPRGFFSTRLFTIRKEYTTKAYCAPVVADQPE